MIIIKTNVWQTSYGAFVELSKCRRVARVGLLVQHEMCRTPFELISEKHSKQAQWWGAIFTTLINLFVVFFFPLLIFTEKLVKMCYMESPLILTPKKKKKRKRVSRILCYLNQLHFSILCFMN